MKFLRLKQPLFIILIILISCLNQKEKRDYSHEFRQIKERFNLSFYHEDSFLILIPLNGCSDCIQTALNFIQNNKEIMNVICIISDIGTKRVDSYLKDTLESGLRIIPDYSAVVYRFEPYLNSPVIYHVKNSKYYNRKLLDSQNAPELLLEILAQGKHKHE